MKVTALVQRSGSWWAVSVPEVAGVFTQAKRLDQVPALVADALATMRDDLSADEVEVTIKPDLSSDLNSSIQSALEASCEARAAAIRASTAMREAVATLRDDANLTVRDTAKLLHITHQRVSQLEDA